MMESQRAAIELARRQQDGLAMFRALPYQAAFLSSRASEILVRGGNRSGKSTIAAARFAAIARDVPLYGPDGTAYDMRLPWQKNRPLLMWVIGLGWDHIGDTIWRLLFRPGLYKMIRDQETHRWRAYNPLDPIDSARAHETRGSFPLIPMSQVSGGLDGIGWENKKERQFSHIEIVNPSRPGELLAVIKAYASTGEVKMGDPVDEIWIDERIAIAGHYPEWQARLSDTRGRICWSTLPFSDARIIELSRRAEEQAREVDNGDRAQADVAEFQLRFSSNPHIHEEEKRKRREGWSEEDITMRDSGDFSLGSLKIYPQFNRDLHAAIKTDRELDDEISKILRATGGEPPADWMRAMILDPGTKKPGVLFGAVPPPSLWKHDEPYFVVYAELYTPRTAAGDLVRSIQSKLGPYRCQDYIIDGHAARQTPMGFAGTVGENYSQELQKANVLCHSTGSAFIPGDPNFAVTSKLVAAAMVLRPCGQPQLRVVIDRCPNLVYQLENNLRKTVKGPDGTEFATDQPASNQLDDLRQCLEYWLSRHPKYVTPKLYQAYSSGGGMAAYENIQRRFGTKTDPADKAIHIGPGRASDARQIA